MRIVVPSLASPPACLAQHGAAVEAYDVLRATKLARAAELSQMVEALEAAAEGGELFEPQDAAVLLLKAISWDRADCLEVSWSSDGGSRAQKWGCCRSSLPSFSFSSCH